MKKSSSLIIELIYLNILTAQKKYNYTNTSSGHSNKVDHISIGQEIKEILKCEDFKIN